MVQLGKFVKGKAVSYNFLLKLLLLFLAFDLSILEIKPWLQHAYFILAFCHRIKENYDTNKAPG